jgi:hypothetical protein
METAVKYRGSKRQLKALLHKLPGILDGRLPDEYKIGQFFRTHLAYFLLQKIYRQWLIKSKGGTDDLGYSWRPLKRETIAARPITKGELKRVGIVGKRVRGLLTPGEDKLWRGIFFSNLKRLASKIGEAKAKAQASQIAWAVLKSMGAKTRLETLGNRKVDIMRVSDRLIKSLTPGRINEVSYTFPQDQIFEVSQSEISIGSKVPYAGYQHKMRPFWPPQSRIRPWLNEALVEAGKSTVKYFAERLGK